MASFRKILTGAVAVAAVGGIAWVALQPEVVPVDLAKVERGALEVTVNADGETRIRDVFDVTAPVTGRVLRSPVQIGDVVVADDTVVARIEPGAPAFLDERSRSQAEAAVAQAVAAVSLATTQISIAEADLSFAQSQLSRVHDLHERGTIPQAQLDQAELAVDVAAAQLDSAHASFDMREAELAAQRAVLIQPGAGGGAVSTSCCIDILAPASGSVLSLENESARMVMAGSQILSIGRPGDLEITADLLSTDAVRITAGNMAYVERWGGPEALEAKVRVIEPAGFTKISALGIEEQRVKVLLDFVTPEAERPALGHGFRVFLRVVEWRGDEVLRLPISALFRENGDWAVFVVEAGQAVLRPVTIGQRNTEFAEVLSGLEPDEVVITHPGDKISDGVLVLDREAL
ncbi:HlyD family efflux transporter periplasmic adaptor subunit [Aliiroseovarius subalbicans]|uniref:efflux RND transporter periplasmic adaptor subunit n=1 Tax=Aliiroseovarius subalbicans TaxID=2925840 RepID=UPI001F583B05|nr:HlyD family efflux transporter periplasmic adaptor subunit [Aliiroseovarius subalbicans]MCI2399028.1 HlyD family efflux transporter periplasmic adaptor subunit [Aliiroseovarius subalbicans]